MEVIKISRKLFCTILFIFFILSPLFANASIKKTLVSNHPWFAGVYAGGSWLSLSKSSDSILNGNNQPPPNNSDHYSIKSPDSVATYSLMAGYRWSKNRVWLPFYSVAFDYQHINESEIEGVVTQYSLPNYENYRYSLKNQTDIFALMGKADIYQYRSFMPYVSLGLGIANNFVNHYDETAEGGIIQRESPAFQSKTNANFAYMLGAGVEYSLRSNLTLSLAYEYENLGNVKTGYGKGSNWSGDKLDLGRLSANTVMLSAAYLFPLS